MLISAAQVVQHNLFGIAVAVCLLVEAFIAAHPPDCQEPCCKDRIDRDRREKKRRDKQLQEEYARKIGLKDE